MAPRVSLFVPCVVDRFAPHIAIATARVLRHLGVEVEAPADQTCCGQPAFNAGFGEEAARVVTHWLTLFSTADHVVTPSGSCAAFVTKHTRDLQLDDRARAHATALANRVHEFSSFVTDELGYPSLGGRFAGRVAWHPSCHGLRDLGIDAGPRGLLQGVEDLELIEIDDPTECCGFGGSFSIDFAELSAAMAADKCAALEAAGVEWVVSADVSCLLHLDGWLRRHDRPIRTIHLAELLARALNLGPAIGE